MKIEIGKRYRNWITGAEVTVTAIDSAIREVKINGFKQEKEFKTISYTKDFATPGSITATGERIDSGTLENIKSEHSFIQTYKPIN